jgi:HPt (histidine-containing phosphotransfer) domain-containing protein
MERPNLLYIESMSGGDKTFERKLIDIIKEEFPIEKEVYFTNIKSKNNKLTAEIVHKLKHKISILGLEKSYEIAIAFENNLIEGHYELQEDFEAVLQLITDYLKQL